MTFTGSRHKQRCDAYYNTRGDRTKEFDVFKCDHHTHTQQKGGCDVGVTFLSAILA